MIGPYVTVHVNIDGHSAGPEDLTRFAEIEIVLSILDQPAFTDDAV